MPVNADIIAWARQRAGYQPNDERILKQFPRLAEWEAGTSRPSYPQLERLSEKLKVPLVVFYFPEIPNVPDAKESFRTLHTSHFDAIPPKIRLLIRKGQAFQISLSELNGGRNPASRLITREASVSATDSVDKVATEARRLLGIDFEEQFSWRKPEDAFKAWRRAFYNSGIYVFKDAFGKENAGFSGFSLHDAEFPVVYINNSTTVTRQIFTLFHELAHLLFSTSGIDTRGDEHLSDLQDAPRRIEVLCNAMAAEALAPDNVFDEKFEELGGATLANSKPREFAERLASEFSVSREMMYRKLRERNYVSQEEYRLAVDEWNAQQKSTGSGGNMYYSWISYLGREYISLAFQRYYQNAISWEELGDHLDIKLGNLERLEDYLLRSRA